MTPFCWQGYEWRLLAQTDAGELVRALSTPALAEPLCRERLRTPQAAVRYRLRADARAEMLIVVPHRAGRPRGFISLFRQAEELAVFLDPAEPGLLEQAVALALEIAAICGRQALAWPLHEQDLHLQAAAHRLSGGAEIARDSGSSGSRIWLLTAPATGAPALDDQTRAAAAAFARSSAAGARWLAAAAAIRY